MAINCYKKYSVEYGNLYYTKLPITYQKLKSTSDLQENRFQNFCLYDDSYDMNVYCQMFYNYFAFKSFIFERTWWKVFQKRVMRIKLDIYVFINILRARSMVVGFTSTYAVSAYRHWCGEFESRSGRGVQHYVIKFVSDLRQVGGFRRVLRFPQ
jgi:hypothetical protein